MEITVDGASPSLKGTSQFDRELGRIRDRLLEHHPGADFAPIKRAFELAFQAHATQSRRSGEPYLVHPLRVARTLAYLGLDPASIAAGLLHDTVEDSEITVVEVTERFGLEVGRIVDGVTKLGKLPYLSREENQAESFRKMLVAMSRDIRVLVVKLADRLDNLQTLEHMPPAKQERIARETMDIYVPLAARLGIEWIRAELEDLAFRYLQPAESTAIRAKMKKLIESAPGFVDDMLQSLRSTFRDGAGDVDSWSEDRNGPLCFRAAIRTAYRVLRMEQSGEREVDQLADIVTYQIITRDRETCYAALGVLHGLFKPAPGRFRDFIALPRPNRYQALHTTVVDRKGTRLEVQIRSQQMDAVAERGVVVELEKGADSDTSKLAWLDSLMDWQEVVSDPNEFIQEVKAELYADEVYVFTPEGDLQVFPRGSTPIDFAFAIHTDVGQHCSAARVNGSIVPLRYVLRQGDTVEILTSPSVEPRREWLEMCGSSRARTKIRQYLRQRARRRWIETGRSLLEQALSDRGQELAHWLYGDRLIEVSRKLGLPVEDRERSVEALLEHLGAGRVGAAELLDQGSKGESAKEGTEPAASGLFSRVFRRVTPKASGPKADPLVPWSGDRGGASKPIVVSEKTVSSTEGTVELATCCSPVPGDPLVGFLKAGSGIVAHVQRCPLALNQADAPRVYLVWELDLELERPVTLEVRAANEVGVLANLSRAFSHEGVNIKIANCRTYGAGRPSVNTFHAAVNSLRQLEKLMVAIKSSPGVLAVDRIMAEDRESR